MKSKLEILDFLKSEIDGRILRLQKQMDDSLAGMRGNTKSTAGDKHETGRAMAQLEQEKLGQQIGTTVQLRDQLGRVNAEQAHDHVAFGSLVETDLGIFFMSIGLGKVDMDGQPIFCLTMASPLGQKMNGKTIGDSFPMGPNTATIKKIS